ncbi:hypothetical protein [Lysinibacillus fusiformis]|uniref:hypothetical protein n=1 Tax=Lysinibacillus fusiformis TaxID=28031 RepID=UPI003558BFBD
MKYVYKFVAISLLVISFFGTNVKQADAYFYCSPNETRCASAFLNYGMDKEVSSSLSIDILESHLNILEQPSIKFFTIFSHKKSPQKLIFYSNFWGAVPYVIRISARFH